MHRIPVVFCLLVVDAIRGYSATKISYPLTIVLDPDVSVSEAIKCVFPVHSKRQEKMAK